MKNKTKNQSMVTENLYQNYIRPISRKIAVTCIPGPIRASKKIAIVGLPRSGTSWLAKAISLTPNTSYYFEPDQEYKGKNRYPYIDQNSHDELLNQHISATFKGQIHKEYTIAEQGLKDIILSPFAKTVLVKWIRLPLSLEWINSNFPDIKVVQIIRHPAPLFLSWKERNWEPDFVLKGLINQTELMNGPLKDYKEIILNSQTYWEKSGALWAIMVYMQLKARRDNWIIKEHEWYCEDPLTRIHWLSSELGLEWNEKIESFLSPDGERQTGPGYGQRRHSKTEITKWHGKLKQHEINELTSIIKSFNLPFGEDLQLARSWFV